MTTNIYANKSTASRVLGKMGVPQEHRAALIHGDVAPFEVKDSEVKKLLKAIKAEKAAEQPTVENMFETALEANAAAKEQALLEALHPQDKAQIVARQARVDVYGKEEVEMSELSDAEWEAQQRAELEATTPEPKAIEKAPRKGRARNPQQNGKTRPAKGVCAAIWDELDKFLADMNGQVPTPAEAQQMGIANNWHKVTVYRQFGDWKKYHGL